jgi:haloalkane dehalogenase
LNPPEAADYWAERANNIETVYIGAGLHYVQEDQPFAIGRAISDWYRRINE